jgi:L-threonylcarbamoyladenylate synthase
VLTVKATTHLSPDALEACLSALWTGEMILYPTETFYAIGIDPCNEHARTKIYVAKGRDSAKQLPCIAADEEMVKAFCRVDHPAYERLSSSFWPGPLTIVLPLQTRAESIAIRVSSHPVARQLATAFQSPIVSTSANRSGESSVSSLQMLPSDLSHVIAIGVDSGTTAGGLPSTIISLLESRPKVLRHGAIPEDQILAAL